MLHRIKELFQKELSQKTGKTGENKSNSRGQITAENGTQERIQQNQHGRTMTEMLGVLAIMGVLSIGALAGYRYAMDKHRANATMNDINLRGVDLVIQASRNIDLNLDEWSNTSTAGYTFGTPEHVADGFVKLPISGLPKRVCEMVVDGLSGQFDMDIGADRYVGDASLCGENNTITVYFDSEGHKIGKACDSDAACGECATCRSGVCVAKADYASCSGGHCEAGICIGEGDAMDTGFATDSEYATDDEWATDTEDTETKTGIICPDDKPLQDFYGNCHSCTTTRRVYVVGVTENCAVCEDRELNSGYSGYCILSACPTDKPLMDYEGNCYSCDTMGNVSVQGVTENCAKCSNRKLDGNFCILK